LNITRTGRKKRKKAMSMEIYTEKKLFIMRMGRKNMKKNISMEISNDKKLYIFKDR